MNRLIFFAAGLIAGFGGALLTGSVKLAEAEAAPAADVQQWRLRPAQPLKAPKPGQRCAPGFKASGGRKGGYGCARATAPRCPNGGAATNLRLYRSGNTAAGQRLLYDCPMSETVKPVCAQGYLASNLTLYRSGNAAGTQRLLYNCVPYRRGN